MDEKEIAALVSVIILLVLVIIIIILFSVFVKRKNKFLKEKFLAKEAFEKELTETRIEIKEETLRNISWELHDNIGQLLTLAKIQLQNADGNQNGIEEAINTIGTSITELRSLSRMINPETLSNLNLVEALQSEIERYNRLKYLNAKLNCRGKPLPLDKKIEIIIFRILQEFFTNTIRHSKATELLVDLEYDKNILSISALDNGVGFNTRQKMASGGLGLSNIKSRAELIGGKARIISEKNKGTQLVFTYKIENNG